MSDLEKLEYIHHIIQECMSKNNSCTPYMLEKALEFVEDIREPYFHIMTLGQRLLHTERNI